jgi:hypothetical protein
MTALHLRSPIASIAPRSREKRRSPQSNPDLGNACCIAIKFAGFTGPPRLQAVPEPLQVAALGAVQTT